MHYARLVKDQNGEVLTRKEAQVRYAEIKHTLDDGMKFWCAWHRERDKALRGGNKQAREEILSEEAGNDCDSLFSACLEELGYDPDCATFKELSEFANVTPISEESLKDSLLAHAGFYGKAATKGAFEGLEIALWDYGIRREDYEQAEAEY